MENEILNKLTEVAAELAAACGDTDRQEIAFAVGYNQARLDAMKIVEVERAKMAAAYGER